MQIMTLTLPGMIPRNQVPHVRSFEFIQTPPLQNGVFDHILPQVLALSAFLGLVFRLQIGDHRDHRSRAFCRTARCSKPMTTSDPVATEPPKKNRG